MERNDLKVMNADIQEQKERVDAVDFKMVTFSLGGKDYGVDIMNVKEIAKADKFTYVPNAASFVRGVYNLRGDIIPIVDLRVFFHLPTGDKSKDGQENMLILRIGDQVFGTIVDNIAKVVGINSETIQPPHPIFGDINIKYIRGVVEKQGQLFIILDVVRIFTHTEEEKTVRSAIKEPAPDTLYAAPGASPEPAGLLQGKPAISETALDFIKESLSALRRFNASPVNDHWIRRRFVDWSTTRSEAEVQLKNLEHADDFLMDFYSPCTGMFWDDDYAQLVKAVLPNISSGLIQVWNPGCGKGYETFSLACILKLRYPDNQIKIWANDNDIMAISSAPNMVFDLDEVPEYCRQFMARGNSGYSFNQTMRDSIMFEYHDILNANPFPELDLILSRDLLSFLSRQDQEKIISDFDEKLKRNGVVMLGRNEEMPGDDWRRIAKDPVSAFMRK